MKFGKASCWAGVCLGARRVRKGALASCLEYSILCCWKEGNLRLVTLGALNTYHKSTQFEPLLRFSPPSVGPSSLVCLAFYFVDVF